MTTLEARLDALVAQHEADAIALRRTLHANPELGWHEVETQATLRAYLEARGLAPRDCAGTGLIADVGAGGRRVIYRGDIDALPIHEVKSPDVPYVSTRAGTCHACGHDVHSSVASLLATVFAELAPDLPGAVRFVLQPAEEVLPSGAARMIEEGAADGVDAAFAIHVDPARDVGNVAGRVGPLTSATDTFAITIRGKSGHSARPFLARDAILASADVVRALYTLIGQRVNPMLPAVLNVGTIHGCEATNVIAGEVKLDGVVRTLHADVREQLHAEMHEVAEAAARVHGCGIEMTFQHGAPPVQNDAALHALVAEQAASVLGAEAVHDIEFPSTGAEDFGMFGARMPQYMLRVGCRAPGAETHHLHTPQFDVDERVIAIAARIMGRALLRWLAEPSAPR